MCIDVAGVGFRDRVSDVPEKPTVRWKGLWSLVSGKTKCDLVKIDRVRPELMRVVYSHLTDAEAAGRIGGLVRSNRQAADAMMRHVREAVQHSREYDTDRAYRILDAAMKGTSPERVRPEDAELFDRERELGWLPLSEAFERLRSAVPELSEIQVRAQELAASPDEFGIVHETAENVLVVPSGVLPTDHRLVGPHSHHPDPLIRSSLAATVVVRYVVALLSGTTARGAWEPGRTRLRITGSFSSGHP